MARVIPKSLDSTFIILRFSSRNKLFVIPDSEISKEQRELFKFADRAGSGDNPMFTSKDRAFKKSEMGTEKDKKRKREVGKCYTYVDDRDYDKLSPDEATAQEHAERFWKATALLDDEISKDSLLQSPPSEKVEPIFTKHRRGKREMTEFFQTHFYEWQYEV